MIIANKSQEKVIKEAVNWYLYGSDLVFQIAGNPGTGKSFVLHEIIRELGISPSRVAPMAYTGAAAIVMRLKGFPNAKTIHSWLLEPIQAPKYNDDGSLRMNNYFGIPEVGLGFRPKIKPFDQIDILVIDEGGMVPAEMLPLLQKHRIKILVAGDVDQLPPVSATPAFLYTGQVHYLTEIMRQSEGSGIIYLSQRILHDLPVHMGVYGDVLVIYNDEVTNDMIMGSDILICGKNETRQRLTDMVRHDIFGYGDGLPMHGERLVCRHNNWQIQRDGINLANGLVGIVENYPDPTSLGRKTFKIDFRPLLINSTFEGLVCDYDYFKAPFKDKQRLKFARFSEGEKMEYAYAITTHISQGSQYANGIYFEEYLNKEINRNLHYTGLTIFSNFCIYVKKRPMYH